MDREDGRVDQIVEEKMRLSERAQEILETLWIETVEEKKEGPPLGLSEREEALGELAKGGYVNVASGRVMLKEKGKKEGARVVRRHRLAERLLADVFDMKKAVIHEIGCRFEHLLFEDVEESVCTLLGHPKSCPHGKPIPSGKCCERSAKEATRVVCLLRDLEPGDRGRIAYLATNDVARLNRLMGMGVLPGISISLLQKFPSYVFQIGESQFAVDKAMAEGIYVRIKED